MQIRFRTVDSVTVADSGYFTKGHNEYVTMITTETPGVPSLLLRDRTRGLDYESGSTVDAGQRAGRYQGIYMRLLFLATLNDSLSPSPL